MEQGNGGRPFRQNNKAQGNRKLTYGQVQDIRTLYAAGSTQGALCREYGVSVVQIGRIVRGEVWNDAGSAVRQAAPAIDVQAALARSLAVQAEVTGASVESLVVPASPLDGGDAPSEADGSSLLKLSEESAARAKAFLGDKHE